MLERGSVERGRVPGVPTRVPGVPGLLLSAMLLVSPLIDLTDHDT